MTAQHVYDLAALPTIRQSKGISLEQIAAATKLKISTLRAIETGDFERLPAGVYAVSYIRQYAREVGVADAELLSSYNAKMAASESPAIEEPAAPSSSVLRQVWSKLSDILFRSREHPVLP